MTSHITIFIQHGCGNQIGKVQGKVGETSQCARMKEQKDDDDQGRIYTFAITKSGIARLCRWVGEGDNTIGLLVLLLLVLLLLVLLPVLLLLQWSESSASSSGKQSTIITTPQPNHTLTEQKRLTSYSSLAFSFRH